MCERYSTLSPTCSTSSDDNLTAAAYVWGGDHRDAAPGWEVVLPLLNWQFGVYSSHLDTNEGHVTLGRSSKCGIYSLSETSPAAQESRRSLEIFVKVSV